MDDAPNLCWTNAVLADKNGLAFTCGCTSTDIPHVLFGKFGVAVPLTAPKFGMFARTTLFATRIIIPAFAYLVVIVVGEGSEKKMARIGVAARWAVAVMENAQASRNRAISDNPRNAMSAKHPSRAIYPRTKAKSTIAITKLASLPRPAFVRPANIDLRPEALFVFCGQWRDAMIRGTHGGFLSKSPCQNGLWASPTGRSLSSTPNPLQSQGENHA